MKRQGIIKRHIVTILLLSFILSISCGNDNDTAVTGSGSEAVVTTAVENTDGEIEFIADNLPELDYEGTEINWLCGDYNDAYYDDIWAENLNGSLVNDSIFNARRSVEERLNITLNVERYQFVWAELSEYNSMVKSIVLSGDSTYDALIGYTLVPLIIEGGYFSNLADNEYLELDMPWWNQSANELMPDQDNIQFITGDATLSLIKHSLCMFFNQDLLDSYQITENLYDVVRAGDWTLDYMERLITDSYSDLNGNQQYDKDDRYGLTFGDTNKYRMLPAAMNVDMYTKTSDGYELTFISERTNDIFTRLQELVNNNVNVRVAASDQSNDEVIDSFGGNKTSSIFVSGNAMFSASLIGDASTILENSTFTLGMIPFPKYDENQDDYYTAAQRFAHIYIPATAEDSGRSGAVLEAWASECYRSVMPTYFETNLKTRYATDSDMAEMFDLLRANLCVEFGTVFYSQLGLNCDTFKNLSNSSWNFASETEKLRTSTEAQLEVLTAALNSWQND